MNSLPRHQFWHRFFRPNLIRPDYHGRMRDGDPPTIALVQALLQTVAAFDLTPDDRATIELIRADITTARTATSTQGDVPEVRGTLLAVSRELADELEAIARKYA